MRNGKGNQALITGASSGIGEVYARKLASLGYDLILAARSRDSLEAIAQELRDKFSIAVCVLPCDLSSKEGMELAAGKISQTGNLAVLINNAGFGTQGGFADCDAGKSLDMVAVHVTAATLLPRVALTCMRERKEGIIINVASLAAFLPGAGNVIYGATKAYLVAFSESLQLEMKGTGVTVQALCPGFTRTGFHSTDELSGADFSHIPDFLWMSAEDVVEQSWQATGKKQTVCVPGAI